MTGRRMILGWMGLGGGWNNKPVDQNILKNSRICLETALECGITTFDLADIYAFGKSEMVLGSIIKNNPQIRKEIFIQTKCGVILPGQNPNVNFEYYRSDYDYIISSAESSLKRMNIEQIDMFMLHRPDPLIEVEEVAAAFDKLSLSGKVKYFGVSNYTLHQLKHLLRFINQPIMANQLNFSLLNTNLIDYGYNNKNLKQDPPDSSGMLEYMDEMKIKPQAYSSLARGLLAGKPIGKKEERNGVSEKIRNLQKLLTEIAENYNTTADVIALAWILRHPAGITPLIGTSKPERIRSVGEADIIKLSREEWNRLYVAGRGEFLI